MKRRAFGCFALSAILTLLACGSGAGPASRREGAMPTQQVDRQSSSSSEQITAFVDAELRDDLEELSRRSVLFGHQSVGQNIVDGLQRLAAAAGAPIEAVALDRTGSPGRGTFAHVRVADNGEPFRKLESFERALAGRGAFDVALMKFCYVDITARTEVPPLFAAYQAMLARLEARYPDTVFVRVTVPLRTLRREPDSFFTQVRAALGRKTSGIADNARREEFNQLLRGATRETGAPLFDLARIESTHPDGRPEAEQWEGRGAVPALVTAYTRDGGHLNEAGQHRAARELLRVIAAAPTRRSSASR